MLGVLLVDGVLGAAGLGVLLLDDDDEESDEVLLEAAALSPPDFALLLDEP